MLCTSGFIDGTDLGTCTLLTTEVLIKLYKTMKLTVRV